MLVIAERMIITINGGQMHVEQYFEINFHLQNPHVLHVGNTNL